MKTWSRKTKFGAGMFRRFRRNERGAIALMFAVSLLPLVMLIGLSVDYSFYVQARTQFELAADAATTYAIREATATYTMDSKTDTNAVATSDAQTQGDTAGAAWFNAQLGTLPTAYDSVNGPSVNVSANTGLSPTNPVGFTASVAYTGFYPPFFNTLFGRTSKWDVSGRSAADSQYSYVELLMLMDTSGSMDVSADIGADSAATAGNPAGRNWMNDNSVCLNSTYGINGTGISGIGSYSDPNGYVNWMDVQNVASGSKATTKCSTGYGPTVNSPCAFACHTQTSTFSLSGTDKGFWYNKGVLTGPYTYCTTDAHGNSVPCSYTKDLYGLARKLGVLLKVDVVFQSTESILQTMIDSDQAPDQFTVGIYTFNDDVCPIVTGNTANGDPLPEATGNLTSALTTVQADDYTYTPTETSFPPVTPSESDDFTNFPLSVSDLIAGNFGCDSTTADKVNQTTGTALAAAPPAGVVPGNTAAYPEKDIFIITDGMEDSGTSSGDESRASTCGRTIGEMTSITADTSTNTTTATCAANPAIPAPVCQALKNLGFSVYVLDINYPPVEVQFYYNQYQTTSDPYTNYDATQTADFGNSSGITSATGGTPQVWNENQYASGTPPVPVASPNQMALEACASSPEATHFYQASSSTAITTAMTQMLASALDSSVRLTE